MGANEAKPVVAKRRALQPDNRKPIQHIIMMGDSLSDRGTFNNRHLLGIFPMDGLAGLRNKSPLGRFSNGYVWTDHLAAKIASEFTIQQARRHHESFEDISEDVLTKDTREQKFQSAFTLGNDRSIQYCNNDFVRNYCEGGLSSADYRGDRDYNPQLLATRNIVSNLSQKRAQLLADDEARNKSADYKAHALIIEWSGSNDLMTVNTAPTLEEVSKLVEARVKNIKLLYAQGYRNFALVNLPDLSLTPRFQNDTSPNAAQKRKQAKDCIDAGNQALLDIKSELTTHPDFPGLKLDIIDANATFQAAYTNPRAYKLNPDLLNKPFKDSKTFKVNQDKTSPAPGYMFWDDVHPTSYVHEILAETALKTLSKDYKFSSAHETLRQQFVDAYDAKWQEDRSGCFGFFRRSNIKNFKTATLEEIIHHGLKEGGKRTFDVMCELGWFAKSRQLMSVEPALIHAYKNVQQNTVHTHKQVLQQKLQELKQNNAAALPIDNDDDDFNSAASLASSPKVQIIEDEDIIDDSASPTSFLPKTEQTLDDDCLHYDSHTKLAREHTSLPEAGHTVDDVFLHHKRAQAVAIEKARRSVDDDYLPRRKVSSFN